jgi:ribosomal protein L7/L12
MRELPVLIVIAIVFLIVAIILWVASRRRHESALDTMRARTRAASEPEPASDTFARVRTLMIQGEKIEAIKVLREKTGIGLAEAKAAVERMEAGGYVDSTVSAGLVPAQLPGELDAAVRGLLQRGNKVAAIKLVRERMKLDLKDAKDLVDMLE